MLAETAVAIAEGAEALGSLLTDGIVIDRKITAGHAVANASNATRISASEKAKGDSEAEGNSEAKKKDPKWTPDPDKPIGKQLEGKGQLKKPFEGRDLGHKGRGN